MSGSEIIARSRAKSHRDHAKDDDDLDGVDLRQTQPPKLMPPRRDSRSRNHHTSNGTFNAVGIKRTLWLGLFAFFVALLLILDLLNRFGGPRVITPITASKLMESPHPQLFEGDEENNKESLYWGTYRHHVYLGIRARTRRSLIAGLMWIGMKDGRYFLRHVCQDSDELNIYSWKHHNDQNWGHQVIVDHDMNLATSFFQSKEEDSGYGGDWAVRVDVQSRKSQGNEEFRTNADLFFYLADEDGNALAFGGDTLGIHKTSFLASGLRTDVGRWQLHLKSLDDLEVHYLGLKMPHIHNLSDLVQEYIGPQVRKFGRVQLPDISDDSPNILIFQISARIPFKTDFAYISGTDLESSRVEQRVSGLTGTSLTSELMAKRREFDTKFGKSFNLSNKVDQVTKFDKHAPPNFAKQVMSQAHGFIQKNLEKTQRLVKDAQTGDTRTVIHSAATEYKQRLLNQSSKLWIDHYPKVQSVAEKAASAAHGFIQKNLEKTQTLVKDAQTGDTLTVIQSATTEYKQHLLNQSSKLWIDHYPKVQSVAEKAASAAHGFIQKNLEKTQRLIKDAQTGDTRTVIQSAATEYKQRLLNQSSNLWIAHSPKVHTVAEKAASAAAYWSTKYNYMVKNLTQMGYNMSSLGSNR